MTDFEYNDTELQMDSMLILCIEEHDNNNNLESVDNRIFIGYDYSSNDYFLRGKRQDIGSREYVPYAFHCETSIGIFNFLEFVIGRKDNVSIVLYNYNNICDDDIDNITYDYFEEQMCANYEIAAYDGAKLTRDMMITNLKMLKNMYNWVS